jgi:metal-sulfur cluster biosynthetic enzyme
MKHSACGLLDVAVTILLGLCTMLPTIALAKPGYADRTDSVDEKLRQMRQAYDDGRLDLALSLAESIKWTLEYERQAQVPTTAQLAADRIFSVDRLPPAWAAWAYGWRYGRALTLSERAGIERLGEPVDLTVAFPVTQARDPYREVRVVRVDDDAATLREIASQIYGERRVGDDRVCHLVFLADVPAHGRVTYLVLHGNASAERPAYPTDLEVTGEGYDLDISNRHFTAHLSSQTGQLERLVYKRGHGLELFSGGKGHGEPPTIDWSNDYVDEGHFQKLRIRNWSEVPNCEVVRGPLCVQVRRWGFPTSPLHPIYTPSRLHIDQTYTFFAGADYFLKEGVMEAVKDLPIAALRDDEWVLSGYSFTDRVWIDAEGSLHEGPVGPGQGQNLWGVGFFHRHSRDAFIALWLEHSADKIENLRHNGSPTLHYYHHGQLWARYPVGSGNLQLDAGTAIRQRNAYLVIPYPDEGAATAIESVRRRFLAPLQVQVVGPPQAGAAAPIGSLARPGETPATAPLKSAIWEALALVQDEQLYQAAPSIVDLGYVYDVRVSGQVAEVLVTMPHRGRPVYRFLEDHGGGRVSEGIRERVLRIDGIRDVILRHTWNPPWTAARMTDAGRQIFGLDD